ncbi:MAG TPA: DNA topoisomerase (ATP-hydrolyzing) subunit B [Planctomycetota bacterium]|nr:DNA topoisomerase (ATP-hydrolyzing) subunit B [Planctomycetota bacterium]
MTEKAMPDSASDYNAQSIEVLMDMDAVRKRPAMYIGDTSVRGLHHLVEEVVANSIDEAMAGHCDEIHVTLNPDGSVSVTDNGRGMPVDIHKETGLPAVEVIMTVLHAGGKFSHNSYKVSGGLHGVGVSVVNALSEWCEVQVCRDGIVYRQEFERGVTSSQLERIGTGTRNGTTVTFKPDPEIFSESVFNYDTVAGRLRELAFLNKGVSMRLSSRDADGTPREEVFKYDGGIKAYVQQLNEGKVVLHDVIHFEKEQGNMAVEIALQYNTSYVENVLTFANNIKTHGGGTHLSGFRSALTRTLNNYAKDHNLTKNGEMPEGEDLREGLTAIVSIKIPDPQFEGQTKDKLGNREAQSTVESIVSEQLAIYLEEQPKAAKDIVNKAVLAAAARNAARQARDLARRKSALSSGNLPVKLADCRSRDVEESELFIVEGDSAGGNAKQCRDSRFQAVLPLRGKILNIEKARLDKMLANAEIRTLISTLGTGVAAEFNLENLRYGKIVIMTDADVDGLHIRTLLLTFFFRQMRQLVDAGRVYIAQPPLYRMLQKKKQEQYFIDEKELDASLAELGVEGTVLHVRNGGRTYSGDDLRNLVALLSRFEHLQHGLSTRGLQLHEYLKLQNDSGLLPAYKVIFDGEEKLFYTETEISDYRQKVEAARITTPEAEAEGKAEDKEAEQPANLLISRIYESIELQRLIKRLQEEQFALETYFPKQDPEAETDFYVTSESEAMPVNGLSGLPLAIRTIGEKNIIDLQRYKGLGEMNPNQLGDTTMDPQTRTLLRVRLEDALEAENIFAILMGSDVKPRKAFIEKHALEAKNIDTWA